MKGNIEFIIKNALCTACGACAGVCAQKAILMTRNPAGFLVPEIDKSLCNSCGKCTRVCPSNAENEYDLPSDIFKGDVIESYAGFATSAEIRFSSQSGGIVTALLTYLIDSNKIDGTIVNKFDCKKNEPVSFCATNNEEILQSVGSYYSQTSVCKTITENSDKKLAAVVLGCQTESINLLTKNLNRKRPEYLIGLICVGQNSNRMVTDLIKESDYKPDKEKILKFRFRDKEAGGWPGNVMIRTSENKYVVPKKKRLILKSVYESHRCITCYDQMNVFSDIVCGDPWGINVEEKKKGWTIVVARTEKGHQLLLDAENAGYIKITKVPIKKIVEGQTIDTRQTHKIISSYNCFIDNNWLYPYSTNIIDQLSKVKISQKERNAIYERLIYSRDFFLSSDIKTMERLSKRRKRTTNFRYKKLRIISFPNKVIKFIVKKNSMYVKSKKYNIHY